MNEAITVELRFFLISILWGAIILFVYDNFRILRRIIPHNSFALGFEDVIFWVLASVFIFAMIYRLNNGTIRGFSVMGMGVGMILYNYILSDFYVGIITRLILFLLRPFRFALRKIKKAVCFTASQIKKAVKSLLTRLNKRLRGIKAAHRKKKQKKNEEKKSKEKPRKKQNKHQYKKKSRKKEKRL